MNMTAFVSGLLKPIFRPLYSPIFDSFYRFRIDYFLKHELETEWLAFSGKPIDWANPRTLNEKIQWLICFSDTSVWTRLADKIQVRDYIKEKGYSDILIPIIGVWNSPEDIDFDILPEKFVLKCNHDSGSVIIVDKNSGYSKSEIKHTLQSSLSRKYGYLQVEPHYNKIPPMIMAESFIDLDSEGISSSPIDYKVFCYNGIPDIIWVAYNREKGKGCNHQTRSLNWERLKEYEKEDHHYRIGEDDIPRPASLEKMIKVAAELSKGFPQVRIDFYDVNGHLYFGEMTFTSKCGRMPWFSDKYQERAGKLVDLSIAPPKK